MNEIVKGGLILMGTGSVIGLLRHVPESLWSWIKRNFLVSLDVLDTDPVFEWLTLWLHEHPYTKKARALTVKSTDLSGLEDSTTFNGRVLFSPAPGHHILRYKGRLVWLWRDRPESASGGAGGATSALAKALRKSDSYNIRVLTRNPQLIRDLVSDAMKAADNVQERRVNVYVSTWWAWKRLASVQPRQLKTVFLPGTQRDDIYEDMRNFLTRRNWYHEKGIPFHRGYLFHGTPGAGKSSFVLALAGALRLNLYSISLAGSGMSDDQLAQLMTDVQRRSIVLFEDIDAAIGKRAADEPGIIIEDKKGTTLSGLLNTLDGVLSREEVIVVMTTNHKDKLDEALIRPGRVDMQVEFTYATDEQIQEMVQHFSYPSQLNFITNEKLLEIKQKGHRIIHALRSEHGLNVTMAIAQEAILREEFYEEYRMHEAPKAFVNSRANCPPQNVGRVFGSIADGTIEGSLLDPNPCIVKNGHCSVHNLVGQRNDL